MSILACDNRPRSRPEQRLERLYVIQPHGLTDASISTCASSHSGGMERRSLAVHASRAMRHTALVDGCVTALGPRVPRGGLM